MEQNSEASALFRTTFPSDDFLNKYYGKDYAVAGNPHRAEIDTRLFREIRRLFDGVLLCGPGHFMSASEPDFERVYVFENGLFASWVDPVLVDRSPESALPLEAQRELCEEFIQHYFAGAFHQREWWQWRVDGDSIWIEVIPEALVDGRPRRKTLDELFDEAGPSYEA